MKRNALLHADSWTSKTCAIKNTPRQIWWPVPKT